MHGHTRTTYRLSRATTTVVFAFAALVAAASATGTELNAVGAAVEPSCSSSSIGYCLVVARTTAFQASNGSSSGPMMVPGDGRITAWQITLGTSVPEYFARNYGGASEAAIAVIEPQSTQPQSYRLVALGPLEKLGPYFGTTARFLLNPPITVYTHDVIAITVPTWAPALALGFSNATAWRASRSANQCGNSLAQTSQVVLGSSAQYSCLYQTAGLTYGATLEPGRKLHAAILKIEQVKITGDSVLVTIKTTESGIVTITGAGLRRAVKTLAAGTHKVPVPLTSTGKGERRQHKKIKLSISLTVDSTTVSASEKINL
jgi:hypothetical protein